MISLSTVDAGRVVGDTAFVLQFKAVYAKETKTRDIPVTIKEDIPEPVFTLRRPRRGMAARPIEVVPEISQSGRDAGQGGGRFALRLDRLRRGRHQGVVPDRLILKRSQCSGRITVRLALNNGGADFAATASILVTEPTSDPWVRKDSRARTRNPKTTSSTPGTIPSPKGEGRKHPPLYSKGEGSKSPSPATQSLPLPERGEGS